MGRKLNRASTIAAAAVIGFIAGRVLVPANQTAPVEAHDWSAFHDAWADKVLAEPTADEAVCSQIIDLVADHLTPYP